MDFQPLKVLDLFNFSVFIHMWGQHHLPVLYPVIQLYYIQYVSMLWVTPLLHFIRLTCSDVTPFLQGSHELLQLCWPTTMVHPQSPNLQLQGLCRYKKHINNISHIWVCPACKSMASWLQVQCRFSNRDNTTVLSGLWCLLLCAFFKAHKSSTVGKRGTVSFNLCELLWKHLNFYTFHAPPNISQDK